MSGVVFFTGLFAVIIAVAIGISIYLDHRRRQTFRVPPIEDDPRFEPSPTYEPHALEPWLDAFADSFLGGCSYGPDGGTTVGDRSRRLGPPSIWWPDADSD